MVALNRQHIMNIIFTWGAGAAKDEYNQYGDGFI